MPDLIEAKAITTHDEQFERLMDTPVGRIDWLAPMRRAAMEHFNRLGFPTTRDEEWKWTNVAPIADTQFARPEVDTAKVSATDLAEYVKADPGAARLVFVNGRYDGSLSDIGNLPDGVVVCPLTEALESRAALCKTHLGRHAYAENEAFVALNTALFEDGVLVLVPKKVVLDRTVHLLHVTTKCAPPAVSHVRNLIVAETSSQATMIETYVGLGAGVSFTNVVTEIVAGENAFVDHYKLVRESNHAYHIATLQAAQQRSSNVVSHTVSLSGELARNNLNTVLAGEGCHCTMNGLSLVDGDRHVDNHLTVDHASAHCNSWEFFKNVLEDSGRGIFSGKIMVREGAQKTDAKQTNMTLLLSPDAQVECKPQLEIFADDVKCTHGATIGQVDEDAVFYLRSRGLNPDAARSLLVYAFAKQCIDEVKVEPLREQLDDLLFARLPEGHSLKESL